MPDEPLPDEPLPDEELGSFVDDPDSFVAVVVVEVPELDSFVPVPASLPPSLPPSVDVSFEPESPLRAPDDERLSVL